MKSVLLQPDWADLRHVEVFCSTRQGGASNTPYDSFNLALHVGDDEVLVEKNRSSLRNTLPDAPELQWLNQVHGTEVVKIESCSAPITADGLITSTAGLACCVLTADCLPIVLASESEPEVAVLHAGWRGLAAGILEQAISKMVAPAADLRAWLGPAIGPCHFEVGDDVRSAFQSSQLLSQSVVEAAFAPQPNSGKFMADLCALARSKLAALGVPRIDSCDICSHCAKEDFYSYRRETPTGRNVTGVYLRN